MYPLTPIISPHFKVTLADKGKIKEWMNALGSPLNLIYPKAVVKNIEGFQSVFDTHRIKGDIFYAHKSSKSIAILKQLAISKAKIDVASEKELQNALSAGFIGQRIEATGPKNNSFLRLALLHGIVLNINSYQEFEAIAQLRKELMIMNKTPVFIRVKEFKSDKIDIVQKDTKFGLTLVEIREVIENLKSNDDLEFYGFSFHLPTISEQERVIAIEQSLFLTLEAIKAGLNPKGINIGGGFSTNFLKSEKEWNSYITAIKDSLLNPNKPTMSWNQSGMGYWADKGKIRGSAKYSDFYRSYDQFQELDKVLSSKTSTFGTIGQFLQENMLTLFIEPGRSLLDQVGITLTKVVSVSKSLKGETVVFLDMNRSHISSIELEFMSDPIIISTRKKIEKETTDGVFLSGNLCLPHDFICRRKVFLDRVLEVGDVLVFINTAGYFMDFTESETIQHPVANKIAIDSSKWFLDEKYEPNFI